MALTLFYLQQYGYCQCYKLLMKGVITLGLFGLVVITVGPLAWYTAVGLAKAVPAAGLLTTTLLAAAIVRAAKE